METRGLRYFTTTARYEHMGLAAAELGIDESTLSRSVARLEKRYGRLFDRIGRRVRLNGCGRVLLAHAERALAELDHAERAISELRGTAAQPVRLGFVPSLGMHFVPELLTAFKRSSPGVRFRFMQAPRERLHAALMAGDLDACIACHKFTDATVAWEPLWDEELLAFVPPTHPLARRRLVDLRELAGEPMLSFKTGERLRDEVDDLARRAGFAPSVVYEAGDIPTLLGLVSLGLGIALLPESVQANRGRAAAVRLRDSRKRTVGLSWLRDQGHSRSADAFRSFVIERRAYRPWHVKSA
jgi:LysR family transcriptional activator of glutamate synthase operon